MKTKQDTRPRWIIATKCMMRGRLDRATIVHGATERSAKCAASRAGMHVHPGDIRIVCALSPSDAPSWTAGQVYLVDRGVDSLEDCIQAMDALSRTTASAGACKLPARHLDLYVDTLTRANRAEKIGHRQLTERRLIAYDAGEYAPTFDDLDSDAAVDLLNCDHLTGDAAPYEATAARLILEHEDAGKICMMHGEKLCHLLRGYAATSDIRATPGELSALDGRFAAWCGIRPGRAPAGFYWPGRAPASKSRAGEYCWLIERTQKQLNDWVRDRLAIMREALAE